jgi:DDE domain
MAGKKHWLWRVVDQEGVVLGALVQSRRGKKAAKRLFRKLLKKQGRALRVRIIDKLKSYAAAKREIVPGVEHRRRKGLNSRAENSHQPTRRRERIMKRYKSPRLKGPEKSHLSSRQPYVLARALTEPQEPPDGARQSAREENRPPLGVRRKCVGC